MSFVALSSYAAPENVRTFVVRTDRPRQTIEHFGASDAWSMKYIGLWPEKQQRQVADWLFSTENDATGKPKGIGLSIWRFNLGAGSEEQGDKSEIQPGTRTECFLNADGTYDWSKQKGQIRFCSLPKNVEYPTYWHFSIRPPYISRRTVSQPTQAVAAR